MAIIKRKIWETNPPPLGVYFYRVKSATFATCPAGESDWVGGWSISPFFDTGAVMYANKGLTAPIPGNYIICQTLDNPNYGKIYHLSNGVIGAYTGVTC